MITEKVLLVGRPNVGKSTLFNRITRTRKAIVADEAGTTRDRIEHPAHWDGVDFTLVDVAGIERSVAQHTQLNAAMQAQIQRALQDANLVVWVVDCYDGVTKEDQAVADRLRKSGARVVIAVNKCDHPKHDEIITEFARFGFGEIVALSASHGRGVNELLDTVCAYLTKEEAVAERTELRIALVGRPNVGKSTLVNQLIGEERVIVSDVAGTTRDAVDMAIPAEKLFGEGSPWDTVRIVDTAGVRRPGKFGNFGVERWSVERTKAAIEESDVVLFMIDGMEGMVHQDLQISQLVQDAGKAVILLVNKWDSVLDLKEKILGTEEDEEQQEIFLKHLRLIAPFLYWIQVVFISAKERMNLEALGECIMQAHAGWSQMASPEALKEVSDIAVKHPRLKNLQYIEQVSAKPPVFHAHVEGKNIPHFSTIRFLDNLLREELEIGPTPFKLWMVPSIQRKDYRK